MSRQHQPVQPVRVSVRRPAPETSFHVALTGHRPAKLAGYDLSAPFYRELARRLSRIVESGLAKHQHLTLHSGMALGADTIWAQVITDARRAHPDRIRFVAEVPVPTQPDRWPAPTRDQWRELALAADEVRVYAERYTPHCLHLRNEAMIASARLLLAIWDPQQTTGGTANGVRTGRRLGLEVFVITPDEIRAGIDKR